MGWRSFFVCTGRAAEAASVRPTLFLKVLTTAVYSHNRLQDHRAAANPNLIERILILIDIISISRFFQNMQSAPLLFS